MKARSYSLIFFALLLFSGMLTSCLGNGSNTSTSTNVPSYINTSASGYPVLETSGYQFYVTGLPSSVNVGSYGLASFTVDWGNVSTGYYTAQMNAWIPVPSQEIQNVPSKTADPVPSTYNDTTVTGVSYVGLMFNNGFFLHPSTNAVTSNGYSFMLVSYADSAQTQGYDNYYLKSQITGQAATTAGNWNVFKFDNINVIWRDTTVTDQSGAKYNYKVYSFNLYYPMGTVKLPNGTRKLNYMKAPGGPFMVFKSAQ